MVIELIVRTALSRKNATCLIVIISCYKGGQFCPACINCLLMENALRCTCIMYGFCMHFASQKAIVG